MSETTLVLPGEDSTLSPGSVVAAPGTLTIPDGAAPIADIEPDAEPPLEQIEDTTGQHQVFDAANFRLDIPEVDGVDAEKIIVAFAGAVELDLTDEKDLAMFNGLTLGKEVELRVAGVVADKGSPLKVDKDGVRTMVRKAKIAVHTLYVLSPEELG